MRLCLRGIQYTLRRILFQSSTAAYRHLTKMKGVRSSHAGPVWIENYTYRWIIPQDCTYFITLFSLKLKPVVNLKHNFTMTEMYLLQ